MPFVFSNRMDECLGFVYSRIHEKVEDLKYSRGMDCIKKSFDAFMAEAYPELKLPPSQRLYKRIVKLQQLGKLPKKAEEIASENLPSGQVQQVADHAGQGR